MLAIKGQANKTDIDIMILILLFAKSCLLYNIFWLANKVEIHEIMKAALLLNNFRELGDNEFLIH